MLHFARQLGSLVAASSVFSFVPKEEKEVLTHQGKESSRSLPCVVVTEVDLRRLIAVVGDGRGIDGIALCRVLQREEQIVGIRRARQVDLECAAGGIGQSADVVVHAVERAINPCDRQWSAIE